MLSTGALGWQLISLFLSAVAWTRGGGGCCGGGGGGMCVEECGV